MAAAKWPSNFQAKPLRPTWLFRLSVNALEYVYAYKTLWHPLQAASCTSHKL
jgi:hypothetical protein